MYAYRQLKKSLFILYFRTFCLYRSSTESFHVGVESPIRISASRL